MATTYATIGKRIATRRRSLNLTQSWLAKYIGLSRVSVVNIERGRQAISVERLHAIAEALRLPVADLISKQTPKRRPVPDASVFKPYIVRRPRGGCQVLFPLSELDALLVLAMDGSR